MCKIRIMIIKTFAKVKRINKMNPKSCSVDALSA